MSRDGEKKDVPRKRDRRGENSNDTSITIRELFPAADNNTENCTVAYKGVVFDELLSIRTSKRRSELEAC